MCDLLLRTQGSDGSWPDLLPFSGIRLVDHCFAMLVLTRTPLPIRRPPIPTTTEED